MEHSKYRVPLDKELECIKEHHNSPTQGYPGITRTVEHIRRNFVFLAIRQKVSSYIRKCESYQKNKALRHAKYSKLQFQEPPDEPWKEVTIDFIVKLPKLRDPATDL